MRESTNELPIGVIKGLCHTLFMVYEYRFRIWFKIYIMAAKNHYR